MPEAAVKREPFERILSPKVKVLYGYKDGRGELRVTTPVGIVLPIPVSIEKIPVVKKPFDRFYDWALKSVEERKAGRGDVEVVVDDRCKALGEHPDGHVDLYVRPIVLSPWFHVTLSREEVLLGKPAMDDVYRFSQLPEDVRRLQGVD